MLVQHTSNVSFHPLLEDLVTEKEVCTYGYDERRSATEIDAMMRRMAASAHEWEKDMQLHVSSLDLKQAFDRVTRKLQYDAVVDSATHPTPAMALLHLQVA